MIQCCASPSAPTASQKNDRVKSLEVFSVKESTFLRGMRTKGAHTLAVAFPGQVKPSFSFRIRSGENDWHESVRMSNSGLTIASARALFEVLYCKAGNPKDKTNQKFSHCLHRLLWS